MINEDKQQSTERIIEGFLSSEQPSKEASVEPYSLLLGT